MLNDSYYLDVNHTNEFVALFETRYALNFDAVVKVYDPCNFRSVRFARPKP